MISLTGAYFKMTDIFILTSVELKLNVSQLPGSIDNFIISWHKLRHKGGKTMKLNEAN